MSASDVHDRELIRKVCTPVTSTPDERRKYVLERLLNASIAVRDEDSMSVMGGVKVHVHADTWAEFVKAIDMAKALA
jgi:hypothetical protein